MENLFETATRMKLRFAFKGVLNIEDLWDLKMVDLDTMYMTLSKKRREQGEDSLLGSVSAELEKQNKELDLKIAIIKYIFNVKKAEKAAKDNERANAEKKQFYMKILAEKENEELKSKSADELRKMIEDLN